MRRLLSAILLAVLFASVSHAATYYVGPSATGDGSGSDASNLKAAGDLTWLSVGDTVYFTGMDYTISWLRWPDGVTYYADRIEKDGIIWYFDRYVRCGQFANKDFWTLSGETEITEIYPATLTGTGSATTSTSQGTWTPALGRTVHGSMVPYPFKQGYDSANPYYEAARNIGIGIAAGTHYILTDNQMIVSTESAQTFSTGNTYTRRAAILTVLDSAPDYGSFRPGQCTAEPVVVWSIDDIDWTCIGSQATTVDFPIDLDQTTATTQCTYLSSLERMTAGLWITHIGSWVEGRNHPFETQPGYGLYCANVLGTTALYLQLDYATAEQKTDLLVQYLQIGLDIHSCVNRSVAWTAGGSVSGGYYWALRFAGIVLGDSTMQTEAINCNETLQTITVSAADVSSVPYQHPSGQPTFYGHYYGGEPKRDTTEYVSGHINMPDWAIVGTTQRAQGTPEWGAEYRNLNGPGWFGSALAAMLTNYGEADCGREICNFEAWFDYLDRYFAHDGVTASAFHAYYSAPTVLRTWQLNVWDDIRDSLTDYPVYDGSAYDIVAPGVPTNIQATATSSSLTITWDAPAAASDGDTATAYRIWWESGYKTACDRTAACYDESYDSASLEVTGLDDATYYTITIAAIDDFGNQSIGATSATFTTDATGEEPPTVPDQAQGFSPLDGATAVAVSATLSWTAGTNATSHDVYFGTDEAAVTAATTSTPTIYLGNQEGVSYVPGTLSFATTYYWRIDEKNTVGTTKGDTLAFLTRSEAESKYVWIVGGGL